MRRNYESDDATFDAEAYTVDGHGGVAWYALGWETEPDEDTEWSGCENHTGNVVLVMVGDDHLWAFDPEDIHAVERDEYCGECGQIGCSADGLDRDDIAS